MPSAYPPDWDRLRTRVYQRDDYTCQNCGVRGGPYGDATLHAHHGVPLSKGGVNDLANLTTYCAECHRAIHGNSMAPTASPANSETDLGDVPGGAFAPVWWIVAGIVELYVDVLPAGLGLSLWLVGALGSLYVFHRSAVRAAMKDAGEEA